MKDTDIDYYAIHPGGKNSFEAVERELDLKKLTIGFPIL